MMWIKSDIGESLWYRTSFILRDHHGRDRMVVGFTPTCAINAYHH